MTTQEFIQQLGKMPVSDLKNKTIYFANGLEISYSVKLAEWKGDLPLQMLIIVGHKGSYVMTYGAETEQDNADLAHLWRTMERRASEATSQRKQDEGREGYALLHKGLQ